MKKNLIFMLSLLMTLTTAFVFSSCEKDENGKEEVYNDPAQWGKALVGNWVSTRNAVGIEGIHTTKTTFTNNLILNADGTGSAEYKNTVVYTDDNSSHDDSGKFSFTWTYKVNDSSSAIYPGIITVKVTSSTLKTYSVGEDITVYVHNVAKDKVKFGDKIFFDSEFDRK